eukprot:CAMPEP_0198123092 /NCGR_PEP_ID=MMETSP1442-20131203/36645_1 /TAXON_ID= /ORGANISM="Craspedostauros australis, Strain CCMP3328" /LENGTH=154 /DNA_ID=CAMNT_0043782245 /DNA_START=225 /DNA_END=689 /DNA_ORIENTATION=-
MSSLLLDVGEGGCVGVNMDAIAFHQLRIVGRRCHHPWPLRVHPTERDRGQLVPVPEEEHGVQDEAADRAHSGVPESQRVGEVVDVEEAEEEEEDAGEERDALDAAQADDGEDLCYPDHGHDQEGQELVAVVELDEEEQHAHHDGAEDEVLHEVR